MIGYRCRANLDFEHQCKALPVCYCMKTTVRDQRVGVMDSCLLLGQMLIHENDDSNSAIVHPRRGVDNS
jgi:hypothetical protein